MLSALLIARIQFGISIGFHYLFPQTTLGLALVVVVAEALYLVRKDEDWRRISDYTVRILAVIFAFGIATGMVMPFLFGMHWSQFSTFAGPLFGVQLTIESITAFTLESAFIAILIFGRSKVSKGLYFLSALLTFAGSHLSAFMIVSANSWLQTPAGYAIEGGRVTLTDWWAATLSPSFMTRFLHAVDGAWITGSFFMLAAAAWLLSSRKKAPSGSIETDAAMRAAKKLFGLATVLALATSLAQPIIGHSQIIDVQKNQPVKEAAYEGLFATTKGAPLIAFGIPDAKNHRILGAISIPYGLSFLSTWTLDSEMKGLEEWPESSWPPVNVIFTTFHLMVPMAFVLLAVALVSLFVWRRDAFAKHFLLPPLTLIALFCAYAANELGWTGAEIGRQPWTIYGVLPTSDSITAGQDAATVAFSLIAFTLVYITLAILAWRYTIGVVRRGIPGAEGAGHD